MALIMLSDDVIGHRRQLDGVWNIYLVKHAEYNGWDDLNRTKGICQFKSRSLSDNAAFYCGERFVARCVVLGPKKSSMYSSEYTSGFSGPAASHRTPAPSPRHERQCRTGS
jgi:hypothetical protein